LRRIFRPHYTQPRKAQVEVKYRTYRLLKHALADQFAHVQGDCAVVFDGAGAFGTAKHRVRHRLASKHVFPPRLGLAS
jgi:hypothetical protein